MLFNSFGFLIFFPCVFILNYLLPFRLQKYMLLLASYYFYMCWKPEFIVLILISTLIDYVCGLEIEKHREETHIAKGFLAVSMCMNLGLLFFFKYFNFFGETMTALFRIIAIPFHVPALDIILPVGISFYTFQTMSYTIDVYRGKMQAERDLITFALFVSYFPQLVAGPIEKAKNLLPQLKKERPFSYENAAYGLKLMAWGFFKKLVIADQLATLFVDPVYQNVANYSGGVFLAATAAFAIQIYCDFGGYSDIARGCARTMGVELMVNFKAPYFALSVTEFWRRWHISLTDWFREYVYIPLGGNRRGLAKKLLFVTVTFLLSGLWHGAAWTFVVWGLLHALYQSAEALFTARGQLSPRGQKAGRWKRRVKELGMRLVTFALCCFAWIFFRAESMSNALYIIGHSLAGVASPVQYCKDVFWALYPGEIMTAVLLFSLLLLLAFDWLNEKKDPIAVLSAWPVFLRWPIYVGFLMVLLLLIPKQGAAAFIYFQF